LDIWNISNHPEIKSVLNQIFKNIKATQKTNSTRYDKSLKDHIREIVLDLYVAYQADLTLYIGYSRSQKRYGENSRYKRKFPSYRNTIKVIDSLLNHGYVEGTKGTNPQDDPLRRKQSRMRATDKLTFLLLF